MRVKEAYVLSTKAGRRTYVFLDGEPNSEPSECICIEREDYACSVVPRYGESEQSLCVRIEGAHTIRRGAVAYFV